MAGLRASLRQALPFFRAEEQKAVDVAIIGGGMVGASLACALGANPLTAALQVAVIDTQDLKTRPTASRVPEVRVSTVTPSSIALLGRLGLWSQLRPHSAEFSSMQVWDWGGNGYVRFTAEDCGRQTMGAVLENTVMQGALVDRLSKSAEVQLMSPATVTGVALPSYSRTHQPKPGLPEGALAELELKGSPSLKASLVVAADGPRSPTRAMAGLRPSGWSYDQRGVVATVRTLAPHQTAWQRFLPEGPLALLPVREGYSNLVWSTSPHRAAQLCAATPQTLCLAINEALQEGKQPARNPWLARDSQAAFVSPPVVTECLGPAKAFPLALVHSGRYVRPRLALLGDAAHAVHPLAGQGVNLGLGDAQCLAAALAHAVETGQDLGGLALLEEHYERPRQAANVSMMASLDGLKRVFTPQSGPFAAVRGLGLDLLNATSAGKSRVMQYAMGS